MRKYGIYTYFIRLYNLMKPSAFLIRMRQEFLMNYVLFVTIILVGFPLDSYLYSQWQNQQFSCIIPIKKAVAFKIVCLLDSNWNIRRMYYLKKISWSDTLWVSTSQKMFLNPKKLVCFRFLSSTQLQPASEACKLFTLGFH